jgi:hypothetical protein
VSSQAGDPCAAPFDLVLHIDKVQPFEVLMVVTVIADDVASIFDLAQHTVCRFVQMTAHQEKHGVGMMPAQDIQDTFVNHAIVIEAIVEGQYDILSPHKFIAGFAPEWIVKRFNALLVGAQYEAWRRQVGSGQQQETCAQQQHSKRSEDRTNSDANWLGKNFSQIHGCKRRLLWLLTQDSKLPACTAG